MAFVRRSRKLYEDFGEIFGNTELLLFAHFTADFDKIGISSRSPGPTPSHVGKIELGPIAPPRGLSKILYGDQKFYFHENL